MCAKLTINKHWRRKGRKEGNLYGKKIIQNNKPENRAYTAEEVYSVAVMKRKQNSYIGKGHIQNVSGKSLFEGWKCVPKRQFHTNLACTLMLTTNTSWLPALAAMWQRPFSSCTLQNYLIWSLHEGQEVFSSARTTAWPSAALPIIVSDHFTLAEVRRLISKVNSNNRSRISLLSHFHHWLPPLPTTILVSTIPNLVLTSIRLPIISNIHAPATISSMFFHKANSPLTF